MSIEQICDEISRIVKFHRKKSGLSQAGLAMLAGVGKTVIYDIEHAKRTVKLDTLLKVFEVLNIKIQFEGPIKMVVEVDDDAQG